MARIEEKAGVGIGRNGAIDRGEWIARAQAQGATRGCAAFPPAPDTGPSACGRLRTAPTKRTPLRAMVRISLCSSPLSATALRAALMRLARVESETIRPRKPTLRDRPC